MTNEELAAIEAMRQAISQGEWTEGPSDSGTIGVWLGKGHWVGWDIEGSCRECFANLKFIANAPKTVDDLLGEVKRLKAPQVICDVCITDSWEPCPPRTPHAVPDRQGGFMVCGYCKLQAEVERLQTGLSAIEARWREASQDKCFRSHFRQTMEECADELRALLNGVDDSELQAEIDKAFAEGEL